MSSFEAQALLLDDPRVHPAEDALQQLGHALMNEVLDVFSETALEDFQSTICESLIGAFHSAAQRIERRLEGDDLLAQHGADARRAGGLKGHQLHAASAA